MNERTKRALSITIVVGFVVIAIQMAIFFGIRNNLVSLKENVNMEWSQVETALQRRNDLIPNLVETVKAYTEHEEKVFSELADARTKMQNVMTSNDEKQIDEASQELTRAVNQVISIAESYPDLKASEQFTGLRDEIAGTENRISVNRQYYNEAVNRYNTAIFKFPDSIVAKILGYKPAEYFKAEEVVHKAPEVNFG